MVSITDLVLLAFATVSAVSATDDCEDTIWECQNGGRTVRYSQYDAEADSHFALLADKKTKSAYPHWFTNGYRGDGKEYRKEHITFDVSWCNMETKHTDGGMGPDDRYLLEFPIRPLDETPRKPPYNFDSKPKDDPGPARVIYTSPHKHFCGIISHTKGNEGELVLCKNTRRAQATSSTDRRTGRNNRRRR
ncbi:MAG: hypothetical protein M1815_005951 [Lichina confinis]|nr:MAG: hypothetical protein M1815_005951 [Lichina confinis]